MTERRPRFPGLTRRPPRGKSQLPPEPAPEVSMEARPEDFVPPVYVDLLEPNGPKDRDPILEAGLRTLRDLIKERGGK